MPRTTASHKVHCGTEHHCKPCLQKLGLVGARCRDLGVPIPLCNRKPCSTDRRFRQGGGDHSSTRTTIAECSCSLLVRAPILAGSEHWLLPLPLSQDGTVLCRWTTAVGIKCRVGNSFGECIMAARSRQLNPTAATAALDRLTS